MTNTKNPSEVSPTPVIYVHARGRRQTSETQVSALLRLGMPVCSRVKVDGTHSTTEGYDRPASLLRELAEQFPDRPVIFLLAGLQLSADLVTSLTAILDRSDKPLVLSLMSNANPAVNPFAGLDAPEKKPQYELDELVRLLGPGYLHTLNHWTEHFTMLSPSAVKLLAAEGDGKPLMQTLRAAGGELAVPDHLFLQDNESGLFKPQTLQTHESASPPFFGELSDRLQQWFSSGIDRLPTTPYSTQPATLHVTHSWGGGIARWIKTFIETDNSHIHFQLRSEAPQSNLGFGQKLSLYAANELRFPIASWWVQPAIQSIEDSVPAYQEILEHICRRYGIGRIMISSLIGHSLDALRSGLPTLQVLHDHFPLWPLLSAHPGPYLSDRDVLDLHSALVDHRRDQEFPDKGEAAWSAIRQAYLQTLSQHDVKIVAPGQNVLELQLRLEPSFKSYKSDIIPHGIPSMENRQAITPHPRDDGRLRMVVLGRIQTGKGQKLLLEALSALTEYVHVYLLGSGKDGEAFFGMNGVDVVPEYEQSDLPDLLATIGPHFAALLSIVPETFSFTLSELQQLAVPVIATRVGSFPDRIIHGETGWLINTDAQELVRQVADLYQSPKDIEHVRSSLSAIDVPGSQEMLTSYNRIFPLPVEHRIFFPCKPSEERTQRIASDYQRMVTNKALESSRAQNFELRRVADRQTEWALDTNRQLKREQDRHGRTENELVSTRSLLGERETQLERLAEQYTLVLNSTSWKITRPLRVTRRVLNNFMLARAWNPARWPSLFSNLVRNVSALGLGGALRRLQDSNAESVPEPESAGSAEPVGDPQPPGAFPEISRPDVSIVLPAYNQWLFTAACLRSLAETEGRYSFEVIVVDDCSDDESADWLGSIEGLNYVRNEVNLGFVGSCNRGASLARGEFLVFLNNDTQVLEGWLDELIDTLKTEPGAGLVGSRLIYPDGRLQESGGIIFNDGSGWNYGREDDADRPEYCFMREVDYCSGACIALRTEHFKQIGPFDTRYAPAYYEDTDLAFRMREAGLKVLVQPASTVIHHEGITSGTDTSSGTKQYQLVNQEKFVARWETELQSQPAVVDNKDDRGALRSACLHHAKGRILFIDASTPEPDKSSDGLRMSHLLSRCRELGYDITFFADNRNYAGPYTRNLQKAGIEVLYRPWLDSLHEFFRNRGADFDYIFISRHEVATNYISLIKRYCPDIHFIFDTVGLHYLREQRLAELEQSLPLKRTAQQTRRSELSMIKAADATLVVSHDEKEILEKDAPGEKIHVISVDVAEDNLASLIDSFA